MALKSAIQSVIRKFVWGKEQEAAFKRIKQILSEPPVLAMFDPSKRTEVRTDTSGIEVGAALIQFEDAKDRVGHPVAYASRKLYDAEKRYTVTHLEIIAVIFAIKKFDPFLRGIHFTIVTDHRALEFMNLRPNELSPKLARYMLQLQEYNYDIVYRQGRHNRDADADLALQSGV